uniref:Cystatin domain-containing protein n=1 Tax=Percolomonas cosmopolitus TaxID=63605 RepID=A0A7S1PKN6_9EUKA
MRRNLLSNFCRLRIPLFLHTIPTQPTRFTFHQQHTMVVGGFTKQNTNSSDIQEVAQFALNQIKMRSNSINANQMEMANIVSAETQVVAGLNYRLVLAINTPNGKSQNYQVTVYKDLQGDMSLSNMSIQS